MGFILLIKDLKNIYVIFNSIYYIFYVELWYKKLFLVIENCINDWFVFKR